MSQDQSDHDNNTKISLQGNAVTTKPGVTSSKLSTQLLNDQCTKITDFDEKNPIKPIKPTKPIVDIQGLSPDQTKAIIALNLDLKGISEYPNIQTKMAKYFADNYLLHQQQFKNKLNLDDFRNDHILNYTDIFGCNKPQSRLYQVAMSIKKRNDNVTQLLQTIQFLTLVQCKWAQKNVENIKQRQIGQNLEHIKLIWKAIYGVDLVSQTLRNKTNVIFLISKFFFFDSDLIEIINNPTHNKYKEFDGYVSQLKKTLNGMGNGFCMFDEKLNAIIKEASVVGFAIEKKKIKSIKSIKKRGTKRNKKELDNNKETPSLNSLSTAGSSPTMSSPPYKKQKLKHPMTEPLNKTKNVNVKPDQTAVWSDDYYSSQSNQNGFDGREKWYVNQSPNCNGYIDEENNVLVVRGCIGSQSAKMRVDIGEYVAHAGRLYLDIYCEEASIELARGRSVMPKDYFECKDRLNINEFAQALPKRTEFPVVIIIPQSYQKQIISHHVSTDLMRGNVFVYFKLKKDSHISVKNSLNSQMNVTLVGSATQQQKSTISFEEYPQLIDTMNTLKNIEPIQNKPLRLYYKESFGYKHINKPQFTNANDENKYWQEQYELAGPVEKALCKALQEKDSKDDSSTEMFNNILATVGMDINTYKRMKQELNDLEKRREIIESQLPPSDYFETTKTLICCKCSITMKVDDFWDISPPLCPKCSKKTYNNKDNKTVANVHPEQLYIGVKIMGEFKESQQFVVGEVFSKYSVEISNGDNNNNNNNKKKRKKQKNNNNDTSQQQYHHIVAIQFVDNIFPIKYYLNAPEIAGSSLKNTKILSSF